MTVVQVGDIAVEVVHKRIKHLHLYVKPPEGKVVVSAPMMVPDERIALFVRENLGWVMKKREAIQGQNRVPPRKWVSGESVYIWGEQYFLEVKKSPERKYAVRFSGRTMELEVPPTSTCRSRDAFMDGWYREELMREAPKALAKWADITGLKANEFVVQRMKRCWGTCAPATAKVRLNLMLAKRDKEALDYVALHELCHLKYRSHGPRFKALLDKYLPNWREVRKRLNAAPIDWRVEDGD